MSFKLVSKNRRTVTCCHKTSLKEVFMTATAPTANPTPSSQLNQPSQSAPLPPAATRPIYGAPIVGYSDPRLYGFTLTRPFRACYYEWVKPLTNPYSPALRNPILECIRRLGPAILGMLGMILFAPFALIGRIVQCIHLSTHSLEELETPKFVVAAGEQPMETCGILPRYLDEDNLQMVFAPSTQMTEILRRNFCGVPGYRPANPDETCFSLAMRYDRHGVQAFMHREDAPLNDQQTELLVRNELLNDQQRALLLRNGFLTVVFYLKNGMTTELPLDASCVQLGRVSILDRRKPPSPLRRAAPPLSPQQAGSEVEFDSLKKRIDSTLGKVEIQLSKYEARRSRLESSRALLPPPSSPDELASPPPLPNNHQPTQPPQTISPFPVRTLRSENHG